MIPEIGCQQVTEATEKQVARFHLLKPYWRITEQLLQQTMETNFP